MELPKEKTKVTNQDPKLMILFGKPKSGKTTIVSTLENNLLIDLEDGSDFVEAMKVKISNIKELLDLKKSIIEAGNPYDYITLDTATALEEYVLPLAKKKYKETPMGKNFQGEDVRMLPNGAGYLYAREAFKDVINTFKKATPHLILLGHQKDKQITKEGKELSENALDLSGKLERIISAEADALGYVYRKKNQTIINFNGGGESIVEARPPHLRGQEITIAESDESGNLTTHWDKIFKGE